MANTPAPIVAPSPTETSIDTKIQALASTAASAEATGGWWAKLVAVMLVALWGWYMKYQLDQRDAELAKAQSDLADAKIAADTAITNSKSRVLTDEENLDQQAAQDRMTAVLAAQAALKQAQADHQIRVNNVTKLSNWTDLNSLAGIK